jgi:hypothetical protein
MRPAGRERDNARMDPADDARALVTEHFPEARAAFLGGGVLSASRTATSDLDIVVIVAESAPAPYRQSLSWRGWPAEVFVQHQSTIGAWFAKDAARRRPTLARMCTGGVTLADADGTGALVRDQALAVLAAGPPPPSADELAWCRYGLTDLLDDLAGSVDPAETAVIGWHVFEAVAGLALLLAGSWLGSGKWLLRELRAADPALAEQLVAARDQPAELTRLADTVLDRAGGRLWAGFRQDGRL